jgi:hypothetical protein
MNNNNVHVYDKSFLCSLCKKWHYNEPCPKAFCKYCKNIGHFIDECDLIFCKYCKQRGHTIKNCTTITCKICFKKTHHFSKCDKIKVDWSIQKILWIGNKKETDCFLNTLPKDLMNVIIEYSKFEPFNDLKDILRKYHLPKTDGEIYIGKSTVLRAKKPGEYKLRSKYFQDIECFINLHYHVFIIDSIIKFTPSEIKIIESYNLDISFQNNFEIAETNYSSRKREEQRLLRVQQAIGGQSTPDGTRN